MNGSMEEILNLQESGGLEEACGMIANKRIERYDGGMGGKEGRKGRAKRNKRKYGIRREQNRRQSTSVIAFYLEGGGGFGRRQKGVRRESKREKERGGEMGKREKGIRK